MHLNLSEQFIDFSHLTCWYQPIYDIYNNKIIAYEALMRSDIKNTINPLDIFNKAELVGKRTLLDKLVILKAQQLFKCIKDCTLFVNIFPSTLLEEEFLFWWDTHSGNISSLVLEISEVESITDWKSLKFIIDELKKRNIKIALDDMGSGYSSVQRLIELDPDYIKLDKYFMIDLANNKIKQDYLNIFTKFNNNSSKIIIEGVENIEDVELLKNIGIHYAQGYALGVPCTVAKLCKP